FFLVLKMSILVPNKVYLRGILLHYFIQKKSAAEAHRILVQTYGDNALSDTTCRGWFRRFKNNDFELEDKERSGAPKKFQDKELEQLLDEDPSQTLSELGKVLQVDESTVSKRLKGLGMIQKQGHWVPYELKPRDVERRFDTCELLLQRQKRKGFLHRIVTGDEKWIHYDNRGGSRGGSSRGGPSRGGFDRGGRGTGGGRVSPTIRGGGPPSSSGPSKRRRFDQPSSQPSNGYATQPPSQGYGRSSNAYSRQQQPQQQQSVGYGSGGYGSQQGYTQSYQGYESYQQPQDYGQTGYPPFAADSRYGGASSVPAAEFGVNDPYSYGKAPPSDYPSQDGVYGKQDCARETEKKWTRNTQKPTTALGRQANQKKKKKEKD
ncbi:MOS1T transposase, partial [Pseudoatta argentina]